MLFRDRAIISLETTDSTNNYAAKLIKLSPPPEGTVITAQFQTEGRGQRHAVWESSESENLLCSFILYPEFLKSEDNFYLSMVIALAIHDLLENHLQTDVFIKWPNDIMIKNKKIAGILIETSWSELRLTSAIAGIGLNVNQQSFETTKATSIRNISGETTDLHLLTEALCSQLEKYYLKLKTGRYKELSDLYKSRLYLLNEIANYQREGKLFKAKCMGVDQRGKLRLELEDGSTTVFDLKEVSLIL
jgi:BirA family transcriptional regulator, biotin operon repressor / biotin---[acetyl-CoA-carboxylase] ligase